uniref:Nucleic acid binding protein n=1 Tax=Arundo donax TaxID=35708 RepID=A0A0A9VEJ5_ARUDO
MFPSDALGLLSTAQAPSSVWGSDARGSDPFTPGASAGSSPTSSSFASASHGPPRLMNSSDAIFLRSNYTMYAGVDLALGACV